MLLRRSRWWDAESKSPGPRMFQVVNVVRIATSFNNVQSQSLARDMVNFFVFYFFIIKIWRHCSGLSELGGYRTPNSLKPQAMSSNFWWWKSKKQKNSPCQNRTRAVQLRSRASTDALLSCCCWARLSWTNLSKFLLVKGAVAGDWFGSRMRISPRLRLFIIKRYRFRRRIRVLLLIELWCRWPRRTRQGSRRTAGRRSRRGGRRIVTREELRAQQAFST